jgi:hypothetical protein
LPIGTGLHVSDNDLDKLSILWKIIVEDGKGKVDEGRLVWDIQGACKQLVRYTEAAKACQGIE